MSSPPPSFVRLLRIGLSGRRLFALALVVLLVAAGSAVGLAELSETPSPSYLRFTGKTHFTLRGPVLRSFPHKLPQMRASDIYSHTLTGMLTPVARKAKYLVYAPDSQGNGVYVIDPHTYRVIRYIPTGVEVQHVVPAWNLRTLYATNDLSNSLTPINPDTGRRAGPNIPVADPYNLYFTPDGRHAIVVEEGRGVLAFRNPHTFALQKALHVHCPGVDHLDFSANGSFLVASCEFSAQLVRVDLRTEKVTGYLHVGGSPQDVKLSPDGTTFYVANRYIRTKHTSGVQLVSASTFRLVGFIRTRLDSHGLYVSRNTQELYVTNRGGESITVIDFATRHIVAVWRVPGTPDMGNLSPNGRILWVSSRYTSSVLAISTQTGHLIASVPAGISPHGVCVWPQPGRYSIGHTGVMR
jgi:DNA-binding beta-propeller fold protein YncE